MLNILLIEDEEADAFLLRRAVQREEINGAVQVASDGKQGIRYLQAEGDFRDRARSPFPDIILTDLNMPVLNGFDFLEWRKTHGDYLMLPTIVLSASNHIEDIEKAYRLGANAYMVKPNSLTELQKQMREIYQFWIRCELPKVKKEV